MKKYKFLIYLISVITCFSSCDSFLELEPEDGVTREKFWKTKEEVKSAVMGCYAAMMNTDAMARFFIWGEARAELTKTFSTGASGWTSYVTMQNGEIATDNSFVKWNSLYAVINNCNTVLEFAKQTQQSDPSFSEELLREYEAEAICIRALMYFYLVRSFGDVPYKTDASLDDDQVFIMPKMRQEEIIENLIADLKSVDRTQNGTNMGIPFDYGSNPAVNKGRFTVWGLKALLADIYLWKNDYESCLTECNQIIGSGRYSLVPIARQEAVTDDGTNRTVYYPSEGDADAFFRTMYANGNSIESIFELQYAEDYENPFYTLFNASSGYVMANMDYMQNDLFVPSALDGGWYDVRGQGVSYRQGFVWKWIGLDRTQYELRSQGESFSNWIFYRLSDVYLMKAEALNQMGKRDGNMQYLEESLEAVRLIRSRACATDGTDLFPEGTPLNANLLQDFILAERAREFAFEGKRWFDVLRNAKRDNYAGINYLLTVAVYAASPEKAVGLQNKWAGDYNSHYLPIHIDEIRNNKLLEQNPFYE